MKLTVLAALFAATAAQALPVQLRSGTGSGPGGKLLATYSTLAACVATKAKYTKPSHCYDVPSAPACPAQPPAESKTSTCPAGTEGDWTQTRLYTAAPAPTCWVAAPFSPVTPPTGACTLVVVTPPDPGGFDAVTGRPLVDVSKIPVVNPTEQYATERIQAVPQPPTGPYLASQNLSTIGAFRELCNYAGMNSDDAIVFPGQPGAAHLHTYFGVLADAYTTSSGIINAATSSCAGGHANRTAYWMPSIIDTLDGTPIKPSANNVYYKGNYKIPTYTNFASVPEGLHLITGDSTNTDPKRGRGRFICYGPQGQNPGWKPTIAAAYADGTCVTGAKFVAEIDFPTCWDGVNLDSPDHKAHVVDLVQLQQAPFTWSCPVSHPVVLPTISYNIEYRVMNHLEVGRWYLSSDRAPAPAGTSAHADYFFGWKPEVVDKFTTKCINEQRDCHNYLLGDNLFMLY